MTWGETAQDLSAPRIQKLLPESPLEDLDIPSGRRMKKLPYFQLDWFCCVWVFFVVPFPHEFSQRMGTEGRGHAAGAGQPQPVRANRRDNTRGCAGPARGGVRSRPHTAPKIAAPWPAAPQAASSQPKAPPARGTAPFPYKGVLETSPPGHISRPEHESTRGWQAVCSFFGVPPSRSPQLDGMRLFKPSSND